MLPEYVLARAEQICVHAAWACLLISFFLPPYLQFLSALLLSGRSFLPSHSSLRSTTCTRIGTCALAAHRQIAAMTHTTIGTDFNEPLDVHIHFAAQVTLNLVLAINHLA